MNIRRRTFMQACGGAAGASLLPGMAVGRTAPALADASPAQVEKSIKAGFGGGFSVYRQARGQDGIQATIGHGSRRYVVVSNNLLDWAVVSGK
ncbi:twin-arginine translocation pathway signal protein [Castellaniella hirudinis]|uniref:twin-arginine translocation pathway signal protein n=1 Tax=Castellaniella hirudinis TaxID=1144617 RepID=UPI0039C31A24